MNDRMTAADLTAIPPGALRVLDALEREYRDNGGWPCSVHTLCLRTGLTAKSSVHAQLHRLARYGAAERGPGKFDGWRPTVNGGFR